MATKTRILSLILITYLIFGFLFLPGKAYAAVSITSVSPGEVSPASTSNIIITGNDFVAGSIVSLEGISELATTFIDSNTLQATVPASIPAGTYTIRVTNPEGTWANLFNALTILAQVSTPYPITTPATTSQPDVINRPIIVIDTYKTSKDPILPGESFNLELRLRNRGQELATNVIVTFQPGDLVPQKTGGVQAVKEIDPGEKKNLDQPLTARYELAGQTLATISVVITYGDIQGNSYSESFSVAVNIQQVYSGVAPTPTSTPTPEPVALPQLVINDYATDQTLLQPGYNFTLKVKVTNLGNADALNTSMVVGGGTLSADPNATPGVGGVSGSGADLTNFATLGSSNVQYLGNIPVLTEIEAQQDLIVNVSTNPGAYPLKISFIYTTPTGERLVDDQVVTLLVYALPVLDVNFYRDPGTIFAGQPNLVPLQIVNLGRNSVVLGNMRVLSEAADLSNNVSLVGTLDAGGYFTLDTTAIPFAAGPLEINIRVDYSDDFNQPQVYSQTLTIDVLEQAPPEDLPNGIPGDGSGIPPENGPGAPGGQETLWQKVVRFFQGLFGLESGTQNENPTLPEGIPPEEQPFTSP